MHNIFTSPLTNPEFIMGVLPFHVIDSDIKEFMEDWPTDSQEQPDPGANSKHNKK